VQSLERAEQLVGIGRIEAGAVVAHVEYRFPVRLAAPDFDGGGLAAAGELPGVVDQVLESDAQQMRIGRHGHVRGDGDLHRPRRFVTSSLGDDARGEPGDVDLLARQVAPARA
jgi:hypothetical protein